MGGSVDRLQGGGRGGRPPRQRGIAHRDSDRRSDWVHHRWRWRLLDRVDGSRNRLRLDRGHVLHITARSLSAMSGGAIMVCTGPRETHWQVGTLPPPVGELMLIGWSVDPAPAD